MLISDKTVIVTGASRGIGLQIVRQLDSEGYRLAACCRNISKELNDLIETSSMEHRIFEFDLCEEQKIKEVSLDIFKWSGVPYGLVNCAGFALGGLFSMTRMEDLRLIYEINLFGPLFLTQLVSKKMLRAKKGSIVNIASTAGILADTGTLAYGGTKASLIHATRVLASELGAFGIRVNAVAPSVVETDMANLMEESAKDKLENRSALKTKTQPSNVADAVSFLLSRKSEMISGQILRIDRGMPF